MVLLRNKRFSIITSSSLESPCYERNETYVHLDDGQRFDETSNKGGTS